MKKLLLTLIIIAISITSIFAQDTIIFKNQDKPVLCKIRSITSSVIFYVENNEYKSDFINNVKYHSKFEKLEKKDTINKQSKQTLASMPVLPTKEVKISDELLNMRTDFTNCHKEFKTGLFFIGGGIFITALGTTNLFSYGGSSPITIIGGLVSLTGIIIITDSHKWIGRAGIGIGGNGVVVKYVF